MFFRSSSSAKRLKLIKNIIVIISSNSALDKTTYIDVFTSRFFLNDRKKIYFYIHCQNVQKVLNSNSLLFDHYMYHLNQFFVIFLLSFILIEKITKKIIQRKWKIVDIFYRIRLFRNVKSFSIRTLSSVEIKLNYRKS